MPQNKRNKRFAQRNERHPSDPQPPNHRTRRANQQQIRARNDRDEFFREGSVVVSSDFGFQPTRAAFSSLNNAARRHAEQQQFEGTSNYSTSSVSSNSDAYDEFALCQTASMFGSMSQLQLRAIYLSQKIISEKKRLPWIPKVDPTAPKSKFALSDEEQALIHPNGTEARAHGKNKKKKNKRNNGPRGADRSNQSSGGGHVTPVNDGNNNNISPGISSGVQAVSGNKDKDSDLLFFSAYPGISGLVYEQLRSILPRAIQLEIKLKPMITCKELYDIAARVISDTENGPMIRKRHPEIYAQLVKVVKSGRPE